MALNASQLTKLGYKFLYSPEEKAVFVYRDGTTNAPGLERLRGETKESIEAQGQKVQSVSDMSKYNSLPGFGFSRGDVNKLSDVDTIATDFIKQLELAAQRTSPEEKKVGIGNKNFTKQQVKDILGKDVPFSQKALDEQYAQGKEAAAQKDAQTMSIASNQAPTTAKMSDLSLDALLKDPKVTQDLGVNGVTMGKWLQGNASLIPKLASLGYTNQDLINEAYAQTRTNKSAFSGDMTVIPRDKNTGITSTSTDQPGSTAGQDFTNYSDLPSEILNSSDWAVLPDDYKKAFYATYHAQQLTNEASKIDALNALKEAEGLADPAFKEALRISQDELSRGISSLKGDFSSKKTTLEDRIKNIEEDLTYNKGELDLSQQSELAQQLQNYKSDLLSLQQSAAESGLAFSSPRTTAEAALASQNEGLVTSTQRKYNQAQRNLATEASRGTAEAQQGLTDLQRQYLESLTEQQRRGETTLGSANVGNVSGVTGLGGITGKLAEQKQLDVLNLQKVLQERQNPFNFSA